MYRQPFAADQIARRVVAGSGAEKLAVVAAHLAPGVVAYLLLHYGREALSRTLRISEVTAQVGIIMTSVMITLGGAALLAPRFVDRLPRRDVTLMLGLTRVDPVGLAIACAFAAVVLLAPTERLYEDALGAWLQESWLALPPWHFQRTAGGCPGSRRS